MMDVANPRRILAVSLAESQEHLSTVIRDLTGAYPEPSPGTGALAGTTQELVIDTPYYSARVPVWLDLIGAEEQPEPAGDTKVVVVAAAAAGVEAAKTAVTVDKGEDENGAVTAAAAAADDDDDDSAASLMTPRDWADAFLAEEAREVRAALGGVVVVLDISDDSSPARRVDQQRDLVAHVGRLIREGLGAASSGGGGGGSGDNDADDAAEYYEDSWDGVGLVVGVAPGGAGPPLAEDLLADWEDACIAAGLEFVLVAPGQAATNEFGEKTGIPRVLEALQANDWNQGDGLGLGGGDDEDEDDFEFGAFERPSHGLQSSINDNDNDNDNNNNDDDDDDDLFDPESLDFGFDRSDFAGLREAIWRQSSRTVEGGGSGGQDEQEQNGQGEDNDDDDGVQSVERMMQKLLAARDLGAGLPPDQRRRLAARAVGEVMREL